MSESGAVFVTGIGTDVGKTLVSAILVEALRGGYWKPIQCGGLSSSDTQRVRTLVSQEDVYFHPEKFRFRAPASPNIAAKKEGKKIELEDLGLPKACAESSKGKGPLIIEGAGGILVPINEKHTLLDLVKGWGIPVVIVSKNYLGSLNHTLLTLEILRTSSVPVMGIVFNGKRFREGEDFLLSKTGIKCLGRLRPEKVIDRAMVVKYAKEWKVKYGLSFS